MMLKRAALEVCLSKGRSSLPRALLLYGPNEGCARYYEQRVVEVLLDGEGAGNEGVVRLTIGSLTKGGKRLLDVLGSSSLFGGLRVVVLEVREGERFDVRGIFGNALEALSGGESFLVVRAGGLRKDSALCRLFEAKGSTFACYEERGADMVPMLRALLKDGGVRAEDTMLDALGEALCRDRLAAQREMEKVVLYYGDGGAVDSSVWDLLSNWREARISEVMYAAFDNRRGECLRALEGLRMSKVAGIALVRSMMRHIGYLMWLGDRSGGNRLRLRDEIMRMRPFVLFVYRERLGDQVMRWERGKLCRLLGEGLDCERRMKGVVGTGMQEILAERYVLGVMQRA